MEKDKKYLITGASGYLGRALIKRLIEKGFNKLVAMSRNEGELLRLKADFPTIHVIPGDVADTYAVTTAAKGVSGVFHLAAFKHVTMAEENVRQCVYSNIIGSLNVLNLQGLDFILGISTDKAAQVSSVYGATKFLQERLFSDYEKMNPNTKYRTVRYGNVMYSTGSVLCKWKDQLQKGETLTVTDEESTRFYWTVDQAVDLIFQCLEQATDSRPFFTPMKAMRLGDLLEAMKMKYGTSGSKHEIIGLQVGENKHEVISATIPGSDKAERYTVEEILSLV